MNSINVQDFKGMLKSACANLENHADEINTLNVFPVPDGDTGLNMSMTFTNGYQEAIKCNTDSVSDVAKAFSRGLLMGARGNSGVITSQIFRGFYQHIEGKETIDVKDVSLAFENGAKVAYKAIMKPVEGTILTVVREASWYANHDYETEQFDILTYFTKLYNYAQESLESTPDYLPILKEVGVVDSGGAGFVAIVEGLMKYFANEPVEFRQQKQETTVNPALLLENEEFGYCTEFIIKLNEDYLKIFDEKIFKQKLTDMGGESLVVVKDDELVKVHVHTLKPGDALNLGQRYGEFVKLKIENMQEQHSNIIANAQQKHDKSDDKTHKAEHQPQKCGIVTVAAGEGITKLFYDLGVDNVITGGQTMNPSTEDFVKVINDMDYCENILIFPNNSNIILAAKQAQNVLSDKNIHVVETKSIQAGLSAIGVVNKQADIDDMLVQLNDVINNVDTVNITYAIKDTTFEGVHVNQGDYMAISANDIIACGINRKQVMIDALDNLLNDTDKELLTVIIGEDIDDDEAKEIEEYINNNYEVDCQIIKGDQPVYSYLIGLE